MSARDSGKPMVDAAFGEVMVTCEKLAWLAREGERHLRPERRSAGAMARPRPNLYVSVAAPTRSRAWREARGAAARASRAPGAPEQADAGPGRRMRNELMRRTPELRAHSCPGDVRWSVKSCRLAIEALLSACGPR